jgi:HEAT repeat protein
MPLFGPPNINNLEKKRDVNALIRALGYVKDYGTRMSAAAALGRIKDRLAVEPLLAALNDEVAGVQKNAAIALGMIGDARAIKPLHEKLACENEIVSKPAGEGLLLLGEQGIDELILALQDENYHVRWAASFSLKSCREQRIINPLVVALSDEDGLVRNNAALALDDLGWKPLNIESEAIYSVAKKDWENCIKIGPPAVDALIAALKKGDPGPDSDVRGSVADVLGKIGDPKAVEPLMAALVDEYHHYKKCQSIAAALVKIGDPRAVAPLRTALNHSEKSGARNKARSGAIWNVSHFAKEALEGLAAQVSQTFFTDIKDANPEIRRQAAKAAFKAGAQAIDPLGIALSDEDDAVRNYAASSLAYLFKDGGVDNAMKQRIASHPEMHVILEPKCAICGKSITDPEPRYMGEGLKIKYFCSDECFNQRGIIYGSIDGVGCPFYNSARMCVPPAGYASPCSYKGASFKVSCHVYATFRPG